MSYVSLKRRRRLITKPKSFQTPVEASYAEFLQLGWCMIDCIYNAPAGSCVWILGTWPIMLFWGVEPTRGSRFLEESLWVYCTVLVIPRMERGWLSTVTGSWNCAHQGSYCPRHWDMDNKLFWRTGTVTYWTRSKEDKRQKLRWELKQLDEMQASWCCGPMVFGTEWLLDRVGQKTRSTSWGFSLFSLQVRNYLFLFSLKRRISEWLDGNLLVARGALPPVYTHLHPPANYVSNSPRPPV